MVGAQQKLQATLRELSSGAAALEPSALPMRPFRGALDWPVIGQVRTRFSPTPGASTLESSGIEIAAAEGTPALAVHDGVVAFADAFAGFGNLVILEVHGPRRIQLRQFLSS